MKRAKSASAKRRLHTPNVTLRLPPRITTRVDRWSAKEGFTTRSEAIRRLLEDALDCKDKERA